ncbi:hypothetical protein [Yoonia sp. BS5-3]|uniref:Uncharacterized protein n=1 Tax=Yoonia phaeophyticola TaxID=3137369 RepID=A0ABZ2V1N6_9RHOB
MRRIIIAAAVIGGTPAFAHHEVVVAVSLAPVAWGLATITAAGLAAWHRRIKMRRK